MDGHLVDRGGYNVQGFLSQRTSYNQTNFELLEKWLEEYIDMKPEAQRVREAAQETCDPWGPGACR